MKYKAKRMGDMIPTSVLSRIVGGPHHGHALDPLGAFDDRCETCAQIIESGEIDVRPA